MVLGVLRLEAEELREVTELEYNQKSAKAMSGNTRRGRIACVTE